MTWLKRPRAVRSTIAMIVGVVAIAATGHLPGGWDIAAAVLGGSSIGYAMYSERRGGWFAGFTSGFVTATAWKEANDDR